ncbi:MAG: hypothetical protein L0212_10685, partial [Acidobacteria bacterium]|nr:hypothetical protein [Acidobacteriota bacterium]
QEPCGVAALAATNGKHETDVAFSFGFRNSLRQQGKVLWGELNVGAEAPTPQSVGLTLPKARAKMPAMHNLIHRSQ